MRRDWGDLLVVLSAIVLTITVARLIAFLLEHPPTP